MSESKNDKAAPSAAKPAAPAPVLQSQDGAITIGDQVLMSAVHGFIQHPTTLQDFNTDRISKVVVDSWVRIQYDAEKLRLATE